MSEVNKKSKSICANQNYFKFQYLSKPKNIHTNENKCKFKNKLCKLTINHLLFIVKAEVFKAKEKIALPALKDAYQNVTGQGYTFKCNKIRLWIPKVERTCSAEMVFMLPVRLL